MYHLAEKFIAQTSDTWQLDELSKSMLYAAAQLHEIGLSVDFKQAPLHAAWLMSNLDLPGFTPAQKKLLSTLLLNQTSPVDLSSLHQQNALPPRVAERVCRLLRLSIIFASRRRDDTLPAVDLGAQGDTLTLSLPENWLASHPLAAESLEQEKLWQSYVHWPLEVK